MREVGFFEEEPNFGWVDIEDAFARAYLLNFYSESYLETIGNKGKEIEILPIYLHHRPYNYLIGRPHYPEQAQGVLFFIQVTALPERTDIERELYAALEGESRLYRLHSEELRRISRRKTEEILQHIREAQIIPKDEYIKETF